MEIDVFKLIDSGSTMSFALLVWWELRTLRTECLSLLVRLDERTAREENV